MKIDVASLPMADEIRALPPGWSLMNPVNIVNDAGNSDQGLSVLGVGNEIAPMNHREQLKRSSPFQGCALLVEFLLLLLDPALLDLILGNIALDHRQALAASRTKWPTLWDHTATIG